MESVPQLRLGFALQSEVAERSLDGEATFLALVGFEKGMSSFSI